MRTKFRINSFLIAALVFMSLIVACKEEEFSEDYDISWPRPNIESVGSAGQALIGSNITITGSGLDKVLSVTIDGRNCAIIDTTESQLVVQLPRRFQSSVITVTNLYRQSVSSESLIAPAYPEVTVSAFPANIQQGQLFAIKGENVDLITSVRIGDQTVSVSGTSPTSLNVPTTGLPLTIGSMVSIEALSSLTTVKGGVSSPIEVIEPITTPRLMNPVVLFDFEDGVNPFIKQAAAGLNPTATLNGGPSKARGNNYLTIKQSGIATWQDIGYIAIPEPVGIDTFTHPHITFLVNTNGKAGYFQLEDGDGGYYHFTEDPDDYKFVTNGWEWRSYDLKENTSGSGSPLSNNFKARLMFKSGNVSGDFEINIDQIMITNGKVDPLVKLWGFEDNAANPFRVIANAPTHGFNKSTVSPFMGKGYYTVIKNQIGGWTDLGAFEYPETLNLSEMEDPHLTFWINTNGNQGYFQLEDGQGAWLHFKFGGDDYKFAPTNGWQKRSISLSQAPWEGTGFNPAAFKPTFTVKSGNIGNGGTPENFELNLDEVYISDGPMF